MSDTDTVSERIALLEGLIRECLPLVEDFAEETTYGQPLCDDPRDFTPDSEVCSEAEIAAWKSACERAEKGEKVEIPHHYLGRSEDGKTVVHLSYEPWGVGTSRILDPKNVDLRERIKAALNTTK